MSETKKSFQWADDADANIREPIEDLKKKGWHALDIPTASNFNWLFNDIQKELGLLSTDLKLLRDSVIPIKTIADSARDQCVINKRNIEYQEGVSRQICRQLREMEKEIRKYHQNFPGQPWPLNDRLRTNAEGENTSEDIPIP